MMREPVSDNRFGPLSEFFTHRGDDWYEFNNGLVSARLVEAWDDGVINIMEWEALGELRSGNTRKSLQQLREFFTNIEVTGIFGKDDPEAPAAWHCWQKMLDEGLIDGAYDQDGKKFKRSGGPKP